MTKIGIIREGKMPRDKRVPFTPEQCKYIMQNFSADVVVQPSDWRVYKNEEYQSAGIKLQEDLSDRDIILGIKEVPVADLIPGKKYLFFSHTIKKQPHNQKLIKALLAKKIQMIDYETMTDETFHRIIGFGHYAGFVGAYNGILGYGLKYNLFKTKRAFECRDKKELIDELEKIHLPNIKIIVTGNGRVANGAIELLGLLHIRRITPFEFVNYTFREPTYTQLHSNDYNELTNPTVGGAGLFYQHPELFHSTFLKYTKACDLVIHCSFWDPRAPKLFTKEEMRSPEFAISVIADVTCDIDGSIPSTTKPSTIEEPFYGYDTKTEKIVEPFEKDAITVMAIDNLPCELPRDASADFGKELIDKVLPSLLVKDQNNLIERATIVKDGKLMKRFEYLGEYAKG
jgi:saccharopine dehydrogenase (NAD+, L-lysine-forming)